MVNYRLAILTHGQSGPLERTLRSFREYVSPAPTSVRVFADGAGGPSLVFDAFRNAYGYGDAIETDVSLGERHGIAPFRVTPFPLAIQHPSAPLGFCGATGALWRDVLDASEDYVFWLEHDFVFTRDVDLADLAVVLKREDYAQVALVRGPENPTEKAAGGIVESRPDAFTPRYACRWCGPHPETRPGWCAAGCGRDYNEIFPYLEHRSFFTTNPSLMRRSFMANHPFPACERECEGRFGAKLVASGFSFAYWGTGEPWVDHIGVRDGFGY